MKYEDFDKTETQEWVDALDSVVKNEGEDRARFLLDSVGDRLNDVGFQRYYYGVTTKYRNTIHVSEQVEDPRDIELERRALAMTRWNAMAIVARANKRPGELGGHISTFASSAKLYDIGLNYFFKSPTENNSGDLVFSQGHSSPGMYARAFMEGRLTAEQLDRYRQEVDGNGLPSYPHPYLLPEFWQFPTVSMGLGPIQAIYQARFMKYLESRGIIEKGDQKVWCFIGDGETDEPETLGAITLAGREKLDNLIFIINCNLQRLDGPVRGNGKIIQELEGLFRGADWNVIKVVWGSHWDKLLERDVNGALQRRMDEVVDGECQNFKSKNGAYIRQHFFNTPELRAIVEDLTDDDIWQLNRGGHDSIKVYNAYLKARDHKGQPTVVLAKTIKGYELGSGQSQNIAHNVKKMAIEDLKYMRDRFNIPLSDEEVESIPYYRPDDNSPEIQYLKERRRLLGGDFPKRRVESTVKLTVPELEEFKAVLDGSGDRDISTTMAFVRILTQMTKDKSIGKRIVPIVADESRTFGMEGMFRQLGIYSSSGQTYEPVDKNQVMYYREDEKGQILQEGINEAGAMSSWLAAGTSYSVHNQPMLPIYPFYSMFGFQRIGDLIWSAGDIRARGFLIGGTSGRTTLNGEGLQHADGHSHIMASTVPSCRSYDPAFGYEVAVIMQHGVKEMLVDNKSVFYYITVTNEQYKQPALTNQEAISGIVKGAYLYSENSQHDLKVRLLGSGAILNEVIAAADILDKKYKISSKVYSVTSFNELRRNALAVERENLLNSNQNKETYIEQLFKDSNDPIIASTDYIKLYAEQIRNWLKAPYRVLGTDGFGRSDTRQKLRHFFEVDRNWVVLATLESLMKQNKIKVEVLQNAIKEFGIDINKPNPLNS